MYAPKVSTMTPYIEAVESCLDKALGMAWSEGVPDNMKGSWQNVRDSLVKSMVEAVKDPASWQQWCNRSACVRIYELVAVRQPSHQPSRADDSIVAFPSTVSPRQSHQLRHELARQLQSFSVK